MATDLFEPRLKLARRWGAKWTFKADDPELVEKARRLTAGRGVDAVVLAVPVDAAFFQAQKLVRGEGKIMLFAHTRRGAETVLDLSNVCVDEKDLIGSYSVDFTLQKEVARWVFSRKLDVRQLVTHEFPLEQTAAAVELAAHPRPESLKIIVVHGLTTG
jgi:L-iditol 2-dehydrogenase